MSDGVGPVAHPERAGESASPAGPVGSAGQEPSTAAAATGPGGPAAAAAEAVTLPSALARAMLAHAQAGAPLEACGIIAGRAGSATRFHPTANADQSRVRYRIAPAELLRITMALERAGETLWGIFHSHPATAAYPSPTDIRLAFYPDALYLIASLAEPGHPVLRGFRIRDAHVAEVALRLA